MEVNQSLRDGRHLSLLRAFYEGRENRESVPIREAPDSVRGLSTKWGPVSTKSEWKRVWRVAEGMTGHWMGS